MKAKIVNEFNLKNKNKIMSNYLLLLIKMRVLLLCNSEFYYAIPMKMFNYEI